MYILGDTFLSQIEPAHTNFQHFKFQQQFERTLRNKQLRYRLQESIRLIS